VPKAAAQFGAPGPLSAAPWEPLLPAVPWEPLLPAALVARLARLAPHKPLARNSRGRG
jgi:hypothetical protein